MKKEFNTLTTMIVVFFLILSCISGVQAAGLLIADGGFGGVLEIREHDVDVRINNGVAVTNVTQIFGRVENKRPMT